MKMISQGQYTDTDLIQRAGLHLKVTSGFSNILLIIHLLKNALKLEIFSGSQRVVEAELHGGA